MVALPPACLKGKHHDRPTDHSISPLSPILLHLPEIRYCVHDLPRDDHYRVSRHHHRTRQGKEHPVIVTNAEWILSQAWEIVLAENLKIAKFYEMTEGSES